MRLLLPSLRGTKMFRVYHDYMTLIVRLLRLVTHVPSAFSVAWKAFVAVNEQGGYFSPRKLLQVIRSEMLFFHPPRTHPISTACSVLFGAMSSHLSPQRRGCSNACSCGAAGRA